jgi:hypothetical protein
MILPEGSKNIELCQLGHRAAQHAAQWDHRPRANPKHEEESQAGSSPRHRLKSSSNGKSDIEQQAARQWAYAASLLAALVEALHQRVARPACANQSKTAALSQSLKGELTKTASEFKITNNQSVTQHATA